MTHAAWLWRPAAQARHRLSPPCAGLGHVPGPSRSPTCRPRPALQPTPPRHGRSRWCGNRPLRELLFGSREKLGEVITRRHAADGRVAGCGRSVPERPLCTWPTTGNYRPLRAHIEADIACRATVELSPSVASRQCPRLPSQVSGEQVQADRSRQGERDREHRPRNCDQAIRLAVSMT